MISKPPRSLAVLAIAAIAMAMDLPSSMPARAQMDDSIFQYVAPERGAPRRTRGAGSRGCTDAEPVDMQLLIPADHTGQTVQERPSFFWYLSEDSQVPLEFSLTEPDVPEPLYLTTLEPQQEGFVQVDLDETVPALEVGKEYRWSVTLVCNPQRPSSNIFVQGWVKRVPLDVEVETQVAQTESFQDAARLYAAAGLWYDALSALAEAEVENPGDPSIETDRLVLLTEGGLENY